MKYFNAVDRNDQDSSDYSTSIRTNRWYLRLVFWALDRVLHIVYVIAIFCANANIGPKKWKQYSNKNVGRMKLQIDLGIELLNFAIELEWADTTTTRPGWLRQTSFIPCDCKKCFFCLNKLTNGIHHRPKTNVVIHHSDGSKTKTTACTSTAVRIMKNSSYCRMCYRKLAGIDLSAAEKKKKCKKSSMGCAQCREPICKTCWTSGYDMHGISC